jgi:hypothetical protein
MKHIIKQFTLAVLIMVAALLTATALLHAGGHSSGYSGRHSYHAYRTKSYGRRSYASRAYSRSRTHRTRIRRSRAARAQFQRQHPCPSTGKGYGACPGYVVDHVKPLACGGADAPSNMQWQTVAEGKAKDKWERIGCK